ncbi:MAG: DUF4332 domain-containing protein [Dehalococcoidia bacterium]|nr:DUF4332 domain-containing protein [Dehalococcoidia bacterium]
MSRIGEIEGLNRPQQVSLQKAGVKTTEDLLRLAGGTGGRQELAQKASVPESQLLEWVNRADLMRIKGIGGEYSDLLEAAGVDTIKELATRSAANLYSQIAQVNRQKRLTRRAPAAGQVERWVEDAKRMQPMVTH